MSDTALTRIELHRMHKAIISAHNEMQRCGINPNTPGLIVTFTAQILTTLEEYTTPTNHTLKRKHWWLPWRKGGGRG